MGLDIQEVKVIPQDFVTLPFFGSVAANSSVTLTSKRIDYPFTTERFRVHFALNTNKSLLVRFFISADASVPTSLPLTGTSIFSPSGQVDYMVGDDETVEVPYRVFVPTKGTYIKVFAENTDSYEHSIDVHVVISRESGEE